MTMTVDAHKETLDFQAEVSQVLNLVIRSLYSNKEIFLRELISNASDAAEKLRFEALTDDALYEQDPNLRIRVAVDQEAGTITVSDNGIGMSRQEVSETIGTIASSGTKRFLEKLSGDETKDIRPNKFGPTRVSTCRCEFIRTLFAGLRDQAE